MREAAAWQYPAACSAEAALVQRSGARFRAFSRSRCGACQVKCGVGDCVSNQCDAAMLTRACSRCVVARLGVLRPCKGPDAIRYDSVRCLLG